MSDDFDFGWYLVVYVGLAGHAKILTIDALLVRYYRCYQYKQFCTKRVRQIRPSSLKVTILADFVYVRLATATSAIAVGR